MDAVSSMADCSLAHEQARESRHRSAEISQVFSFRSCYGYFYQLSLVRTASVLRCRLVPKRTGLGLRVDLL